MSTINSYSSDVINTRISLFSNVTSKKEVRITISDAINMIRNIEYKNESDLLRRLAPCDEDAYKREKKKLRAVTFSAEFIDGHSIDDLVNYNRIMVVDIDKLDVESVQTVLNRLRHDKHVFAGWVSPSGLGIKALVIFNKHETSNIVQFHRSGFEQIQNYFRINYEIEIDSSGKDIPRLCFITYSEELFVKEFCEEFNVILNVEKKERVRSSATKIVDDKKKRNILYNPRFRNDQRCRKIMRILIKYLNKNNLSITYEYSNWHKVGLAIAREFTFDVGLTYFDELSQLDKAKYDKEKVAMFLKNCYIRTNGLCGIRTILDLARNKGFYYDSK